MMEIINNKQYKVSSPSEIQTKMLQSLESTFGEMALDLLPELSGLFMEDAPNLIGEIQQAISTDNAQQVQKSAHTLKGSCASMGIHKMAEISQQLESMGRTGSLGEAGSTYNYLYAEYQQVATVLQQYL